MAEASILVGKAQRIVEGSYIEPEFTLQSYRDQSGNVITNARAAAGIVRATIIEQDAAHHVMRDVVRQRLGRASFGGQVSLQWDTANQVRTHYASDRAKEIILQTAEQNRGIVGYIHNVAGNFYPKIPFNTEDPWDNDEIYLIGGPHSRTSYASALVVGSHVLSYEDLENHFGPNLDKLTPSLDNPLLADEIIRSLGAPSSRLLPS